MRCHFFIHGRDLNDFVLLNGPEISLFYVKIDGEGGALRRLYSTADLNPEELIAAVYEQWLFSDLKDSSLPSLQHLLPDQSQKWIDFHDGMIESLVDISKPFHSQYKALTYEFEDNTGFSTSEPESEKCYNGKIGITVFTVEFQNVKRVMVLSLSDGFTSLKGVEYREMPALSLLTSPGCKVLLRGRIGYRRDTLLLTGKNCAFLGGENENFFRTGRPVNVMGAALEGKKSESSDRRPKISVNKRRHSSPVTVQEKIEIVGGPRSRAMTKVNGHIASANASTSQDMPQNSNEDSRTESSSTSEFGFKFNSRKTRSVSSTGRVAKSGLIEDIVDLNPSNLSPGNLSTSENSDRKKSLSSTVSAKEDQAKPLITNCLSHPNKSSNSIAASQTGIPVRAKFIKKEIKEEEDEDLYIIEELPVTSSRNTSSLIGNQELLNCDHGQGLISSASLNPLVVKFLQLEIVSIADALKASRFCVGSKKRRVAAIVSTIVEPLRIVDDMWTMTVCLMDETSRGLNAIIAHSVLLDLIGLTPDEAKTIRASNDKARRREGTARLKSVRESIERLDLVWEIEFYAAGKSTPVVRNMQTLSQSLQLVD
ncbi:unnamed protein product [Enterobius vermicularis]|uniref:RecQ-mediated genome instability protein 1 n=1 Tax=Enterobius vermicularis TaxID=51028 RepID=A0A0N4VIZ9_ENTVE|nr:unnamed protein product [Enterobius vermicularis]